MRVLFPTAIVPIDRPNRPIIKRQCCPQLREDVQRISRLSIGGCVANERQIFGPDFPVQTCTPDESTML
jgi:hypothetical protein